MKNAIAKAGATLLKLEAVQFEPSGLTIVAVLAESHASIHTYPEKGVLMADAFTCGSIDPEPLLLELVEGLGEKYVIRRTARGESLPCHVEKKLSPGLSRIWDLQGVIAQRKTDYQNVLIARTHQGVTFESFAYRDILMDYFKRGARWRAAPKPQLSDALYRQDYDSSVEHFDSVLTEVEPVFDAADFVRIGRDIIGQYSHVTNRAGAQWLARELGSDYKVHMYNFDDAGPMHIDTTLLPIAPGRVLVNKAWVSRLPDYFKDWEILTPPPSTLPETHPLLFTSRWISVNILMLDSHHVLVEESETPLIEAFKSWNIEAIPVPFKHFQTFGGSFHCATLDVRRGAASASI
ncbi:S-adenosylmethionine decarboxylase [Xenorhabdus koppenhoeferi]|uniref:S-adenosylmethionine decarboxylase n=2 Tax=Xenorhabdus koppenhoeferi TaxID=351659 RepID=A0A1I7KI57_9GAMM|nr:S-adenosylmethionine decarboxylase [Xenorhabdus koppenhoeferi]